MFFLHCMIKILTDEKFLVELMNWLRNRFIFCNSIHRAIWWVNKNDESILFFLIFLLEKAAFDLLVFCFITAWFSLDMSGETNSFMSLVCSPVCWDWFVYWWYVSTSSWSLTSRMQVQFLMTHVLHQKSFILLHMEHQSIYSFGDIFPFSSDFFTYELKNLLSCTS